MVSIPNNVLVLSDVSHGGAAGSTKRLLKALVADNSTLRYWHFTDQKMDSWLPYALSLDPMKRPVIERVLKNFSRGQANRLRASRHRRLFDEALQSFHPTLMNVRNIHDCGLDHAVLQRLYSEYPLVWTMHDCWPYREYAFEYWDSSRGKTEYSLPYRNPSEARVVREQFFSECPGIVMVGPSKWIVEDARSVLPETVNVEHIPNGVPTQDFRPICKETAKSVLGLDLKRLWFGFASTWANSRKGSDLLIEAAKKISSSNVGFVAWGGDFKHEWPEGIPVRHFGRIYDDSVSRLLYSAIDCFICPSRADNLPNTCLEALACGTPLIGSSVGGIRDMAKPGSTGWLFENNDINGLALTIEEVMDSISELPEYNRSARELAVQEFDVSLTAQKYAMLYSSLARSCI
jgi:glycosyltransferase involved in cell wall biosynthesis